MEATPQAREKRAVRVELDTETSAQPSGDANHKDRLPGELSRRAVPSRSDVGGDDGASASPLAEPIRREARKPCRLARRNQLHPIPVRKIGHGHQSLQENGYHARSNHERVVRSPG